VRFPAAFVPRAQNTAFAAKVNPETARLPRDRAACPAGKQHSRDEQTCPRFFPRPRAPKNRFDAVALGPGERAPKVPMKSRHPSSAVCGRI